MPKKKLAQCSKTMEHLRVGATLVLLSRRAYHTMQPDGTMLVQQGVVKRMRISSWALHTRQVWTGQTEQRAHVHGTIVSTGRECMWALPSNRIFIER